MHTVHLQIELFPVDVDKGVADYDVMRYKYVAYCYCVVHQRIFSSRHNCYAYTRTKSAPNKLKFAQTCYIVESDAWMCSER